MKLRTTTLDDARAARLATRHGEDPHEIRKVFGKSFRPHSRAANRKGRRAARRILRDLAEVA